MRILRTNLQYVTISGPLNSLLITSPSPSEGKTLMSANLSATYAMAGLSVIVAGVDLRKPTIHRVFKRSNAVGLTNVLVGQTALDDALVDTEVPGLRLLPAGPVPPNPAELLGSKMRDVIKQLLDRADMVILDAPPVLAVTDASVLASMVAGTLLIVDISRTNRELAKRAKDQLDQVRANVVGLVANRIDRHVNDYYYYYDYYGYQEPSDGQKNGARAGNHTGLIKRLMGVRNGR